MGNGKRYQMLFLLGVDGRTPEAVEDVGYWAHKWKNQRMIRRNVFLPKKPSLVFEWKTIFRLTLRSGREISLSIPCPVLVRTEIMVSTIFLGVNHSFGYGAPLLFETMVFRGKKSGQQYRYSTYEDAVVGHERLVSELFV